MANYRCISCKSEVSNATGSVHFKCPNCGEEIIRCVDCRINAVPYVCPKCGFEGP